MQLIIAEKPSVAQTIAAVMGATKRQDGYIEGGGYVVSWCVGHLVGLAEAAAYGSSTKNGAMTAYPFCRRNGNTPLLPTNKSNSKF